MTELAAVMPELAPVLLGAFSVIALSVRDFHTSQGFSNIRYAVLPERYLFALSVYATVAVFFYFVILNFLWLLTLFVDPDSGSELGVPATIFIFVVAPAMPWIGKSISAMRRLMWTLARYPESVETLTALIARSPFIPSYKGRSEVVRELTRYGVPSRRIDAALAEDNKVLTVAAARILQEVCSLHVSFTELRRRDQSCDYQRGRLLDGVAVAIVMGAVIILLQLGIVALGAVLQVPLPDFPLKTRAVFTGLFSVLGFAMGYLVPSTAQAHIEAIKIILTSADNKGYVVGWATRNGQPIASQASTALMRSPSRPVT
jgi:hypothetical protein